MTSFRVFAALVLAAAAAPAQAQDFYRGKQVQLLIGGTAGGGVDVGARMLARHLGKHLPGQPAIVPRLMPGAGGLRAMDHLGSAADRDGTAVGTASPMTVIAPLIGKRQSAQRATELVAIGAMAKEVSVCMSLKGSRFATIQDAMAAPMMVAGTGAASSADTIPVVLNEVLKTKFKVITGFQGTRETAMAIERGETDGRCGWSWSSLKSTRSDWVRDGRLNVLLQLALAKDPAIPDAPLVMDLVKDDAHRQMLALLLAPLSISRPLFASPGTPPERVAELRAAFAKAMADPELRTEAVKLTGEEVEPTSGEDVQKLIAQLYATPPVVVERLKAILAK